FPAALPPRAINAFVPLCRSQVAVASAFVPPPPIPTFLTPTRVHDLKNALSHGTFCSILKGAQPMTESTAPATSPEPIKVAAMDRLEPSLRANVDCALTRGNLTIAQIYEEFALQHRVPKSTFYRYARSVRSAQAAKETATLAVNEQARDFIAGI